VAETLESLQKAVTEFRDARDWKQFHQPKDLALGLQVEAAELAELFLWKTREECQELLLDTDFRARLIEELGDVQIFLLYLAEATSVSLEEAVKDKLAANERKYPIAKAKGNATKWTELK
jgi:NTP pyrophosphatase (non-canonical NTP hydrolase)